MNPLVKKEIRLLLPGWVTSLLLTLSIWLLPEHLGSRPGVANSLLVFPFLLCPLMLIMTVIGSFGREFSSGTFSLLLAQPVTRARIWWTKTLFLLVGVLAVWFVWCYSQIASGQINANLTDMEVFTALFALAVYSGGLWTVLLLRQAAAAFWFTVLTPAALLMTVSDLLQHYSDNVANHVLMVVFTSYGIAGFWFAHWLFMRAQDSQWTGGTIAMPEVRGLARFKTGLGTRRIWRPRAALLIKELQLHQSQFLIAGVLALLQLGAVVTRKLGHFPENSSLEFVLENFVLLWLVVPLLVGCAAVAEERKSGTLEGQFCLPIKRRRQFTIKWLVVLSLSIMFGTLMPLLLEGERILPDFGFKPDDILIYLERYGYFTSTSAGIIWVALVDTLVSFLPILVIVIISVSIATVSFYASTLARNTLQALAPAVLGILLTWFLLFGAYSPEEFINYPLWRGWLFYLIGIPVLLVVLGILAYWNYQRVLVGWNTWRKNLLTIAISLTLMIVTTTVLYHRVWELLTPLEPPHGIARLTNNTESTRIQVNYESITVFLSDGRVWLNRYTLYAPTLFSRMTDNYKIVTNPRFGGSRFLDGTNWADLADCGWDIAGIQRDGSLWVSEKPEQRVAHRHSGANTAPASTKLVRFGSDHDWKKVTGRGISVYLLKTDGSLWFWGINQWNWKKAWPGLRAFNPVRLGTNSDWAEIFGTSGQTFFCKTDGQMWVSPAGLDDDPKLQLAQNIVLGRVMPSEGRKWRSILETYSLGGGESVIGILENGTLCILAQQQLNRQSGRIDWVTKDIPLGGETNWVAMIGNGSQLVTLKSDGSLWLWNFHYDERRGWRTETDLREYQNTTPVRLGTHSDWIAVGNLMGSGVVSLAADGSLWLWRFPSQHYYFGQGTPPLLMVSRRPELLGNIFNQPD
ncbi:MAG TPA: hypothetical protein VG077_07760 [Verrucomicrobiae bacterium]|nr:hypothetical protein [Verrucomicrobiae bacterium]